MKYRPALALRGPVRQKFVQGADNRQYLPPLHALHPEVSASRGAPSRGVQRLSSPAAHGGRCSQKYHPSPPMLTPEELHRHRGLFRYERYPEPPGSQFFQELHGYGFDSDQ